MGFKNQNEFRIALCIGVIKGIEEDGSCKKIILENMMLSAPTVETHLFGAKEIIDRRANIKK